jgi:hypothetical protein
MWRIPVTVGVHSVVARLVQRSDESIAQSKKKKNLYTVYKSRRFAGVPFSKSR